MKNITKPSPPILKTVALVTLFIMLGCQPADTSRELKPVLDAYAEAWNTGDLDGLDEIIAPQFVRFFGIDTSAAGLDSLKNLITTFRTTYPDFHVTVDEEIYAKDRVIGRWTFTATNTGPGTFPPTGKHVTVTGISIFRITDGKIVQERLETDNLSIMEQLGFTLTPPGE